MALGLEPAFAPGGPVWPFAGTALTALEPADPDLAIPRGALQNGMREAGEHIRILVQSALLTDTPPEPLRVAVGGAADRKQKWSAALVASCIFHVAVALFFIGTNSEEALLEGSEHSGIVFLGSAPEDQTSAGDLVEKDDPNAVAVTMITMLEAKPVETIEAEPLQTEKLQPMAEQPLEQAPADEPLQAAPSERAETAPSALAEPPSPAVEIPQILATDTLRPVEDDQAVPEIVEMVPEIPLDRIPLPAPRPVERPAQKVGQAEPVKQAAPKPKPGSKVAWAQKPAKKPAAKPAAKARQSGNGGQNQTDAQRGQVDGQKDGRTAANSKGGKSSAVGNAAVANYPGKVASKLRRALRYPAEAKRQKLHGQAQVSFVVSASGGVGSIRVVASSGSPVLDRAAIETVRRAAPFPAIPAGAGRSSWPFTVPLAFNR